jgi:hypothetical protein
VSSLSYVAAAIYVGGRGWRLPPAIALAAVGAGSVLYHGPMPPGAAIAHDLTILGLAVVLGHALWRRWLRWRSRVVLLLAVVAIAVNLLTRSGAPLCRPDSVVQGHGLWHVLTALALGLWIGRPPRAGNAQVTPRVHAVPHGNVQ